MNSVMKDAVETDQESRFQKLDKINPFIDSQDKELKTEDKIENI